MAGAFLQNPAAALAEVEQSLQLSEPATDAYRESKQKIISVLEAAKLEYTKDLRPTSDVTQFEGLQDLVAKLRDLSYKIIESSGDPPEQPLELLAKAGELLNVVDIHISVLNHVKQLFGQPTSVAADVGSLGVTMKAIMTHLEIFRTEVKKCLLDSK